MKSGTPTKYKHRDTCALKGQHRARHDVSEFFSCQSDGNELSA